MSEKPVFKQAVIKDTSEAVQASNDEQFDAEAKGSDESAAAAVKASNDEQYDAEAKERSKDRS